MSALRASAYRPRVEEDVVSRVSGTALNLGMRKQNAYEALSAICHSTDKESP